jgi:DmsE family decaheme c-type cytochrome
VGNKTEKVSNMNARILFSAIFIFTVCLCAIALVGYQPSAAEDSPGTSEACLDCHDDMLETLSGTTHEIRMEDPEPRVACTACHVGDAERHMEDDSYHLALPSGTTVAQTASVCATCHTNSHQQNMEEFNVHAENDVKCIDCHKVHSNTNSHLLKKSEPRLCLDCHPKTEGDFFRSFRHPVLDEVVKCSECHLSLDVTHRNLSTHGVGEVCTQCHNQFQGPFPFEHQASVFYSTEEGGCLTCHEAHGSNVPRMLKQPYEAPHYSLCTQCHTVPKHQMNSKHDTQWSGVPCNDCHVDIHGSYDNKYFLSPSLRAQGCTAPVCHSF